MACLPGRAGLRPLTHVSTGLPPAAALPPTVADSKRKFVESYKFPIPAIYNNVVQELLVAQHLTRYNANYAYGPVRAARTAT